MAANPTVHIDDAIDFIARYLATKLGISPESFPISVQSAPYYDLQLKPLAAGYWAQKGVLIANATISEGQPYYGPFIDAAWQLCRMGVLRPSLKTYFSTVGNAEQPDGYSVTDAGREWLADIAKRPPTDPARIVQVLGGYEPRFGRGFIQRAGEGAACYRAGNYLACCTMLGAAAEFIMFALATAKLGDERAALREYQSSGGRGRIARRVLGNVTDGLKEQFTLSSAILSYWRDESAHGIHSSIGEAQAYSALGQLLRFAQLCSDNWAELTS